MLFRTKFYVVHGSKFLVNITLISKYHIIKILHFINVLVHIIIMDYMIPFSQ